jgi:hypothetical protein
VNAFEKEVRPLCDRTRHLALNEISRATGLFSTRDLQFRLVQRSRESPARVIHDAPSRFPWQRVKLLALIPGSLFL